MPKVKCIKGLREGRGYSTGEILKAGLDVRKAKALKIRVDKRRKTVYDFNIQELIKIKPRKKEKTPLTSVRGIGPKRAAQLRNAGIDSANSLANADLKVVSEKTGISLRILKKYAQDAKKVV
jgi:predicted flap endonuclease-1-like 5' DNA nuclease